MRTGFLLAEDEALKKRLASLTVTDDREVSRPVQVFFRYPDVETERTYPFITIEMIDIVHARNRQHSENELYYFNPTATGGGASAPAGWEDRPNALTYWPSESSDFSNFDNKDSFKILATNEFVPVDLVYQVSTYTRTALHDRQMTSTMLRKVFPFRRSSLHIDADNTDRRLEMLDWTTADLLDAESGYRKRIFRKIYTLQMGAELPSTDLHGYKQATSVVANIDYIE
jgi:hypothetical protein